jgi:transcriptional regulator with XRE-family HTH domain
MALDPKDQEAVDKAKALPKAAGRPPKEFGPVIKAAACALHASGLTKAEIARELNVSPITVGKMLSKKDQTVSKETLEATRAGFSAEMAGIVKKMLTAASSDDYIAQLAKSRNPGLITAMAQLVDKIQLLEGKPSSITEVRDTARIVEASMKELEDMEVALRQSIALPKDPKAN